MLYPRNLLTQLDHLAAGVDGDLSDLAEQIADVTESLRQAVSGSAGLQITVVRDGCPITLDVTEDESAERTTTSLRVPLLLLSSVFEPGGRVVFYSTVPGALVDLAADLTYILAPNGSHAHTVELDVDLPLVPGGPVLDGVDDLATLNRAAGVLISEGHHPDTACQALHSRAAAQRLTPLALAHQLLSGQAHRCGPGDHAAATSHE